MCLPRLQMALDILRSSCPFHSLFTPRSYAGVLKKGGTYSHVCATESWRAQMFVKRIKKRGASARGEKKKRSAVGGKIEGEGRKTWKNRRDIIAPNVLFAFQWSRCDSFFTPPVGLSVILILFLPHPLVFIFLIAAFSFSLDFLSFLWEIYTT